VNLTGQKVIVIGERDAGPLTEVALRLPVYHIFEPEVKEQIPADVYARSIGKLEILHDVEATVAAMQRARAVDA
jgi:glycine reductase